jgi:membrane protein YqaA with SNARE-associated domain
MKALADSIQAFATAIGGPGLFIIAFLDSSFLSFPEVNDLLVVTTVLAYPHWLVYYAGLSTLGSLLGCLTLYYAARHGGERFIRTRFRGPTLERATRLSREYGVVALLVPSLLPPPAPFKIFVLLAGVSGVSPVAFTLTIALGRGIRFFGIGLLTFWYGEAITQMLAANGRTIAYWLAGGALAVALAVVAWKRLRRRTVLTSAAGADIMPERPTP